MWHFKGSVNKLPNVSQLLHQRKEGMGGGGRQERGGGGDKRRKSEVIKRVMKICREGAGERKDISRRKGWEKENRRKREKKWRERGNGRRRRRESSSPAWIWLHNCSTGFQTGSAQKKRAESCSVTHKPADFTVAQREQGNVLHHCRGGPTPPEERLHQTTRNYRQREESRVK